MCGQRRDRKRWNIGPSNIKKTNKNGLVHGNDSHLIKEPLETTGLKEGATGRAGHHHQDWTTVQQRDSWRTTIARIEPLMNSGSSWRTTTARTRPQTRQEETGGKTPIGHSGRIALRREHCDVFGRMPSLVGNRKLNTSMDMLTTRYCRVARLPSNRGRMVTWIRSPLGIVALYGCLATVVECFHWDSPML
jgi:hypothetical protein